MAISSARRFVVGLTAVGTAAVAVGTLAGPASAQVTEVTESTDTLVVGQSVSTTAHDDGTASNVGAVQFLINDPDNKNIGDQGVTISNGTATLLWTPAKAGVYTITATSTDLTGRAVGTPYNVTVTVAPAAGTATGSFGGGSAGFGSSGSAGVGSSNS